jgi:hypothetical protein
MTVANRNEKFPEFGSVAQPDSTCGKPSPLGRLRLTAEASRERPSTHRCRVPYPSTSLISTLKAKWMIVVIDARNVWICR